MCSKETFFVVQGPSVCQEGGEQSSGGLKGKFKEPPGLGLEQRAKALLSLPLHLQRFLFIETFLYISSPLVYFLGCRWHFTQKHPLETAWPLPAAGLWEQCPVPFLHSFPHGSSPAKPLRARVGNPGHCKM